MMTRMMMVDRTNRYKDYRQIYKEKAEMLGIEEGKVLRSKSMNKK